MEDPPDVFTVELVDAVLVVLETEISKKDEFQFLVVLEHPALLVKNQQSPQAALDKKVKLTKRLKQADLRPGCKWKHFPLLKDNSCLDLDMEQLEIELMLQPTVGR